MELLTDPLAIITFVFHPQITIRVLFYTKDTPFSSTLYATVAVKRCSNVLPIPMSSNPTNSMVRHCTATYSASLMALLRRLSKLEEHYDKRLTQSEVAIGEKDKIIAMIEEHYEKSLTQFEVAIGDKDYFYFYFYKFITYM